MIIIIIKLKYSVFCNYISKKAFISVILNKIQSIISVILNKISTEFLKIVNFKFVKNLGN